MIDCIDQFKSSFENYDVVFEKNVNFAHDNLIKTFNTIVYLKIFNNNKLQSNISLDDVIHENFVEIYDIIVNANSNTFIFFMLNAIEKKILNDENNELCCVVFRLIVKKELFYDIENFEIAKNA